MYKVLVIAYYFPPLGLSGVQRTLKLCKYMKDYNWEPTVITTGKTGYYAHDDSMLKEAENAKIITVRTSARDVNSLLARFGTIKMPSEFIRKMFSLISKTFFIPDNKKSWAKMAYQTAAEILKKEKYDLIFISIPPFSVFGSCLKLGEEFNIPVFTDYRDLWFSNQFRFFITPYHKFRHKKMEEALVRKVDKILVTNRYAKEQMLFDYPFLNFKDVIIAPHGYDSEDFKNISIERENRDKLVIGYSGIFYETVTPTYFLLAFKKLTQNRPDVAANIELHFIGDLRSKNRKLINKLGLHQYVHEFGYMNHKEAIRKLMNCDILWVMLGRNKNSFHVAPGKLFEYFASRKPIIACADEGAITRNAVDYGASIVTEPDNVEQIMNAIIKMYEDFKNDSLPIPDEEFIAKHDRKFIAQQITKEFQFYLKED
ncbi:MAG: glycosyltransferase family 4 protein [Bacteroidetes bacterium]|nr:glycosyltransferase family 4 protein [Bacteroidota bacterium]